MNLWLNKCQGPHMRRISAASRQSDGRSLAQYEKQKITLDVDDFMVKWRKEKTFFHFKPFLEKFQESTLAQMLLKLRSIMKK